MDPLNTQNTVFPDSKSHYKILDGLRGVAAVTVVLFHIMETFALGDHTKQIINHGYLAVDFFFLLSGYVIGYAYDDRWGKMSLADFFKRRLIRLHPMIIAGMVIGAIAFFFQDSEVFPKISQASAWEVLLVMLIGFTLIPLTPSLEIRGWTEMHPLDGPAWSLFFEYIANIMYALFVRRFSNTVLSIFVFLAGAALIHLAVTSPQGDVIGGWSLEPTQLRIGFTRLLYPFFAGLLLSRVTRPTQVKNAFVWCSLLLLLTLAIPRVGNADHLWMNGLYDALSIILIFPVIVYLGASGEIKSKTGQRVSKFLGDISYPLYITHYPLIYCFTAWSFNNRELIATGTPEVMIKVVLLAVAVLVSSIAIAYACVRWYDVPVRKWLTKRYIQ